MESLILLANIGNRNLKLNGEVITPRILPEGVSYRDFTRNLMETQDERVELNILDVFLRKWPSFSRIHLFASDGTQSQQEKTDQDTIHAAEIVKRILLSRYGYDPDNVTVHSYGGNPAQEEQLLQFYMQFIRFHLSNDISQKIIVADAGGTAQMRSGLKIACEFLLGRHAWEAHYKKVHSDDVEQLPLYTYRRIIASEQYVQLLPLAQYAAAPVLFASYAPEPNLTQVLLLSELGELRKNGLYEAASSLDNKLAEIPALRPFQQSAFKSTGNTLVNRLGTLQAMRIADIFSLAELYAKQENHSLFCLQYCVGMEVFTQCMLSDTYVYNGKTKEIDMQYEIRNKDKDNIIHYLVAEEPEFVSQFKKIMRDNDDKLKFSFTLLLHFLNQLRTQESNQDLRGFIELMMQIHSTGNLDGTDDRNSPKGIDKLRNMVAHKGAHISRDMFEKEMAGKNISSATELCRLTNQHLGVNNTFLQINASIRQLLRQ